MDDDGIGCSGTLVVICEPASESAGIDAHDGVDTRVVIGRAAKYRIPNYAFLEFGGATVEGGLDDEAQERAQTTRRGEQIAHYYIIHLAAYGLLAEFVWNQRVNPLDCSG